jgi:hypothetical protein
LQRSATRRRAAATDQPRCTATPPTCCLWASPGYAKKELQRDGPGSNITTRVYNHVATCAPDCECRHAVHRLPCDHGVCCPDRALVRAAEHATDRARAPLPSFGMHVPASRSSCDAMLPASGGQPWQATGTVSQMEHGSASSCCIAARHAAIRCAAVDSPDSGTLPVAAHWHVKNAALFANLAGSYLLASVSR